MLYLDDYEVIEARKHRCESQDGCNRGAGVRVLAEGGESRVALCAWHLLYGDSQWGVDNRDEVMMAGPCAVAEAKKASRSHVPVLDGAGRFSPQDAERFALGLIFTSRLLKQRALFGAHA